MHRPGGWTTGKTAVFLSWTSVDGFQFNESDGMQSMVVHNHNFVCLRVKADNSCTCHCNFEIIQETVLHITIIWDGMQETVLNITVIWDGMQAIVVYTYYCNLTLNAGDSCTVHVARFWDGMQAIVRWNTDNSCTYHCKLRWDAGEFCTYHCNLRWNTDNSCT
jgi:hypothetical protein